MKNIAVTILVALIIGVLVLELFSFQVRETETVVVTRFGEPKRPVTEPGWYWKWLPPVEKVHTFDSRLQVFEGVLEETSTKGGDPIIVTTYIVWKIARPQKFLESVGTIKAVQEHLRSRLRDKQNSIIGRHYFSEFVNSDREKIRFAEIEAQMLQGLAGPVKELFPEAKERFLSMVPKKQRKN